MAEQRQPQVLIIAGDEYEDLELHYPRLRLREAGCEVVVAGQAPDTVYRSKHGYPVRSDVAFTDVAAEDFDGLVIPGGRMPDALRTIEPLLRVVREFVSEGRVIAAICHGGQILISAGVVEGKRMTCYQSVRDDLVNAGAEYEDAPVIVDEPFVTSRVPDDLPDFCGSILEQLAARTTGRATAAANA
ncbi:MAG: type 1 glutamine amidotransferase domain-containing protein [Planctomycetota bacterium]|nr:type 1 glutamine amidotransferase domain-containing protein [Planctomycetota bacterium]